MKIKMSLILILATALYAQPNKKLGLQYGLTNTSHDYFTDGYKITFNTEIPLTDNVSLMPNIGLNALEGSETITASPGEGLIGVVEHDSQIGWYYIGVKLLYKLNFFDSFHFFCGAEPVLNYFPKDKGLLDEVVVEREFRLGANGVLGIEFNRILESPFGVNICFETGYMPQSNLKIETNEDQYYRPFTAYLLYQIQLGVTFELP
jgi:hypothetical protein